MKMFLRVNTHSLGLMVENGSITEYLKSAPYGSISPISIASPLHRAIQRKQRMIV